MKYKFLIFILFVLPVTMLPGCKKFVERGNVNINPNQPSLITLNTYLPAIENATASNYALLGYITTMLSQQMAAYTSGPINEDRYQEVRISSAYAGIYQNGLTNSWMMQKMAVAQGSPHYSAIARILFVTNLILATDTWGDVPLSQAFQSPTIIQPQYDRQESVYGQMHLQLDSAIAEIGQSNPATLKPGIEDLIFAGDMASWKQTAYFLKARLYMHTTKKGAVTAANNAINAMANAFTSSSKPYQLVFSDRNNNPWFVNVSGRISGSQVFTIGPSKRFVEALNGVAYPGLFDPRIDTLMFKRATVTTYIGIANGGGNTNNTVDLTDVTIFGKKTSPLLMGSYAEQKLMEAEARFLVNGGTATSTGTTAAAYSAYIEGIKANLSYLGYNPTTGKGLTYISNPLVASSATTLTMELIMREKQVALYLNPEAWTDVRRYDYNPGLFKGMALPLNINTEMSGNYIRRAMYPLEELNRNPNALAVKKPMTEKVWWDE